MSGSSLLRITLVVGVILSVSLTAATVVQTGRVHSLQTQLEETRGQLDRFKGPQEGGSAPVSDEMLRQLLAEKEADYAKLSADYARLQQTASRSSTQSVRSARAAAIAERRAESVSARPGPGAWLEQLRKQDPQRYQQIVAQREQRRQQADQAFQEQLAALDTRAQTAPTQTEADLANQVADTLTKLNDLRTQMQAARNLPEDNPQRQAQLDQLGTEMRATNDQLGDLRRQDRTLQLQNLGDQLGLKGDSVQTLVDSVPQIYQNTRYGQGGGGGGGPGGFGGFGGPGTGNAGTPTGSTTAQSSPSSTTK